MRAPSNAAYSALLAERDEFKNRCKALIPENQCIQTLAEEANELHAMVPDIEKSNALVGSTSTKARNLKNYVVAEECVIAFEADLTDAQDA